LRFQNTLRQAQGDSPSPKIARLPEDCQAELVEAPCPEDVIGRNKVSFKGSTVYLLLLIVFFFCLDTKEAKDQGFAGLLAKNSPRRLNAINSPFKVS